MDNQSPKTPSQQPLQPLPKPDANISTKVKLWGHTRLGLLILGIFGFTIWGRMCGHKEITDKIPGQTVEVKHPSSIQVVSPKKIINKYIPPEGNITITPKDPTKSIDDLVKIHYQEIGWTFEPGLELSGNLYYSYGVDAKLFYAYRFGLGAGLVGGSNVTTLLSPDIFVSYRLDQIHLRNTEAIVTYVPAAKIPFGLGVRINL